MKLGLMLPMFAGDAVRVLAFARTAEALGADGVFAFDHFRAQGGDRPALEPFTCLAAVAAVCPSLTVGTLVVRCGTRPPGLLAKMAAQLDDVSGGGFVLGLGAGDERGRREIEAQGLEDAGSRAARIRLLDETTQAVRTLFAGGRWPGGDLVPPLAGPLLPAPRSGAALPLWIGGRREDIVRIAAARADAWNGWGLDARTFAARADALRACAEAEGRACAPTWGGIALVGEDGADLARLREARRATGLPEDGVWMGTADAFGSFAAELSAAGASWMIVAPAGPAGRLEPIFEAARRGRAA